MDIEDDEMNDFCQECGSILELPLVSDYIECTSCNFKIDIKEYKSKEIITTKEFRDKKDWLIEYMEK